MPEPSFIMDYEKVLSDLQKKEKIDVAWVKANEGVLTASFDYRPTKGHNDTFFQIQANRMNENRNGFVEDVKAYMEKEKSQYIKSIWNDFIHVNPPYVPENKEKNLLGLKALQKYGTREDMLKLHNRYQLSKDNDIMREYAKLVGKVGETIDTLPLRSKLTRDKVKLYNEETIEEIMKTLKAIMVDKAAPNTWVNYSYSGYLNLVALSKHENKIISENAKAVIERVVSENDWLLK